MGVLHWGDRGRVNIFRLVIIKASGRFAVMIVRLDLASNKVRLDWHNLIQSPLVTIECWF